MRFKSITRPLWTGVDLILVVVLLIAAWGGWRRGFIHGSLDLITWISSILIGYNIYPYTANGLDKIVNLGAWLLPLAFILTTTIARILVGVVVRRIVHRIPRKPMTVPSTRFFGIIPGIINGVICATIIAAFLLALPLKKSITKETQHSQIARTLSMQAEWANKNSHLSLIRRSAKPWIAFRATLIHTEEIDLHFTSWQPGGQDRSWNPDAGIDQ